MLHKQGVRTMNRSLKIIVLSLLVSTAACRASATTSVRPFLHFRSQGQDLARQKVGSIKHEYLADKETHNGAITLTAEYTRSFNNNEITKHLFGCFFLQNGNTLHIVGSNADSFDERSLAAEWFGLARTYEGSICFKPTIQNSNADLNFYWGMDDWIQGLFLRITSPLTWTKWNLGAKFSTIKKGSEGGATGIIHDAEDFFCKKSSPLIESDSGSQFQKISLDCARFCGCCCDNNKTKTRLADIHMNLGWNFLLDENYHLGFFIQAVAPTGNKPKAEWLFEPIVGNGHHWELGGGLTSSISMWSNKNENKELSFSLDAEVTHLFNSHQNRVFDLKDKPLSRYIFARQEQPNTPYKDIPLANLTSCNMNVKISIQADVIALFNYTHNNWSYDLGYNFWIRSCEKFDCSDDDCDCSNNCTSCYTCCGQCVIKKGIENWFIHPTDTINNLENLVDIGTLKLTNDMIDYDGARTKGMSHKIFGHINYSWIDRNIIPFLGIGGFTEFGINDMCCTTSSTSPCSTDNSCCKNSTVSQWGLWLKGGVSF